METAKRILIKNNIGEHIIDFKTCYKTTIWYISMEMNSKITNKLILILTKVLKGIQ